MSDELVDPASAAEAKAIQFLQIAVMAAEGIAVLAAARAGASAARTEADAGRLLTSVEATRASAEPLWQPALDPARLGQLNDRQALTAWSAAQPWRDVEPAAEAASRASLERLRELQPHAVDAYDALRDEGKAPAQAMRSVVQPLTNVFIKTVINSSLNAIVGLPDLTGIAERINIREAEPMLFFGVGLAYVTIALLGGLLGGYIDRKVRFSR